MNLSKTFLNYSFLPTFLNPPALEKYFSFASLTFSFWLSRFGLLISKPLTGVKTTDEEIPETFELSPDPA